MALHARHTIGTEPLFIDDSPGAVHERPVLHLNTCRRCGESYMFSRSGLCMTCESSAHRLGEDMFREPGLHVILHPGPRILRLIARLIGESHA